MKKTLLCAFSALSLLSTASAGVLHQETGARYSALSLQSNASNYFSFDNCGFANETGYCTNFNGGGYSTLTFTLGSLTEMRKFTNWDAKENEFRIMHIRLFNRSGKATTASHEMEIIQGDEPTSGQVTGRVISSPCTLTTSSQNPERTRVYASLYPTQPKNYYTLPCCYDYYFNANHSLVSDQAVTLKFPSTIQLSVMQPYDASFMAASAQWTPPIYVEGVWVKRPNSINLNFASGYSSARGFLGYFDVNSFRNIAGGNATVSVDDTHHTKSVSVTTTCQNTYRYLPTGINLLLGGYIDDTLITSTKAHPTITVSSPFPKYKVIIYQATDTANVVFSPPSINGTVYAFDGSATGTLDDVNLRYGKSQYLQPTRGVNMVIPDVVFTGDLQLILASNLVINNVRSRGGIAALQIIEVE